MIKKVFVLFVFSIFFINFTALAMQSPLIKRPHSLIDAEGKLPDNQEKQTSSLPWELTAKIIVDTIPDTFENSDSFFATIKYLKDLAVSNKREFYKTLQQAWAKKAIIQKLFDAVQYKQLDPRKFPKKISNDPSILGTINNILFYLRKIELDKIPNHNYANTIHYLVEAGVNPNFFVGNNNLLHTAIVRNLPSVVQYLIDNGADINTRNLNYREYTQGKTLQFIPQANRAPFILALQHSPASISLLLENPTLDITRINEDIMGILFPYSENFLYTIKKLVEKGLDSNIALVTKIGKYNMQQTTSLLGFALAFYPNKQDLNLVTLLLDHGADVKQPYYNFITDKRETPLEFVQNNKTAFPELYDVIKEYEDNPKHL